MKKTSFLTILSLLLIISTAQAQDQGYFGNLISALNKGHSAEAITSLGAYKATLLGCLMNHSGQESACKDSVTFAPTTNFTYEFLQEPKDNSNAWSMKAVGKGEFNSTDTVMLTSDQNGNVICEATGKLAGAC